MDLCEDCKEKRCIDTTCRTCWPKDDKSDRALYHGLMNGDNVEFKPDRDFTDTKASEWPVHNELIGGE